MSGKQLQELTKRVLRLRDQGRLPVSPTDAQRADWAYGNTVIENEAVTREMAEKAVAAKPLRRP